MGTSPDQIRTEIERTRSDLTADVDRLADRTSPSRIITRKTEQAKGRLGGWRDKVMGTASEVTDTVSDRSQELAGNAADAVRSAPEQVLKQTKGSPLAAGLIAFGAGLLTAALVPVSGAEQRMGGKLREHSDELVEPAKQAATEAARHIGEDLKEAASDAVDEVKETARHATGEVAGTAEQSAARTKEQVTQSAQRAAGHNN